MRRVIVLGGSGQFGRTAIEQLRSLGIRASTASRRTNADLQIDAEDANSIRLAVRAGDVVVDTAGPFHARSTALVEAAIHIGFDVVDINDDLQYALAVLALAPRIEIAGIRVLVSASTVSAVAAAVVRHSGSSSPTSVTAFLAPASRHTAHAGAALSLLRSVGRPVRVFRDGQQEQRPGWSEPRRFPMPPPIGPICGRLFESADAIYLPRIWPTLRNVAMHVDTNTAGVNRLLRMAAHRPTLRRLLENQVRFAARFARFFGSTAGGVGYEIEDDRGRVARYAMVAHKNSFVAAVAPAVLAAHALAEDRFAHRGLVLPDRHVEPAELFRFLQSAGMALRRLG
jgi:saccharopine dehydrogenase-like NADP-dependent oxidoreductase